MNADTHLDSIAIKHLMWKPSACRNVAREIVEHVLPEPHTLWPDELHHDGLSDADKHCVGTAYRLLMRGGIIQQTGHYRRSTAEGRAGGAIFEYQLRDIHRAKRFLEVNPRLKLIHEQTVLPLNPNQNPANN